jgi:hypothetical protein
LKTKSQSIAYSPHESEHVDWILDLENAVHSIWVIWTSGLQECKGHAKLGGETLALLLLPLPAAMMSVMFIRGILKDPLSLLCGAKFGQY